MKAAGIRLFCFRTSVSRVPFNCTVYAATSGIGEEDLSLVANQPHQHTTSPMNKLATILRIFTAFLFSPNAKAWSGAGHQVIAAEAYRQISPALQKKATEILKAHPDYEKWKESFTSESATLDLPNCIFMGSSTWPDEIRRRGNQYDHPHWHHIDYPLKPPTLGRKATRQERLIWCRSASCGSTAVDSRGDAGGLHRGLRARSRMVITNSATPGSFNARGPVTFSTRILFPCDHFFSSWEHGL